MLLSRITALFIICTAYHIRGEVDLITEPRPGEEYVLVSGGQERALNFESSHKIPEKLSHRHSITTEINHEKPKKFTKSHVETTYSSSKGPSKNGGEGIVSIEEIKKNKKVYKDKATEAVEIDVPASKLEEIKIKETVQNVDTNPNIGVDLEAMSETGRLNENYGTTTQKPILTVKPQTTQRSYDVIPINFDSIDDINSGLLFSNDKLEPAGTEQKQHSRIQIKKGPNGQDYEYEYIYYYEDEDDEDTKAKESKPTTQEPVHNAHDGPQKAEYDNKISKTASKDTKYANKYSSIERTTPTTALPTTTVAAETQNEVLPASQKNRHRGRNLTPAPVQEEVNEERLPASTRFPPRSRNLNPTPPPTEVPAEPARQRSRGQTDSKADESAGQSRSRTRAHVRRPSSELVDLSSFNTHSSDIPLSQYKEIPSRFSAEGKANAESAESLRTSKPITSEPAKQNSQLDLETQREPHSISGGSSAQEISDYNKQPVDYKHTTDSYYDRETTEYTTMMAMEKVALDLYAYLAGENLNNEVNSTTSDLINFESTTTEFSEDLSTTEQASTTEEATTVVTTTTPPPTTTPPTTTTTTTQAPTSSTRPSRFKGRGGLRGRVPSGSSSTTETPTETSTKVRGRFNRPTFGSRGRTSTAPPSADAAVSETASKQESSQPQALPKPGQGRARFGSRARPTPAPAPPSASSAESAPQPESAAPRARPRPTFHLRERRPLPGATTAAPADPSPLTPAADQPQEEVTEATPAPAKGIGRGRLPGLRPLRPGPRLTIGRASSPPPADETSETSSQAPKPDQQEASAEPAEVTSSNPLQRLRGRPRLQVAPSPRPKTAPAAPVRRPNPLISRRRPAAEVSETPTESAETATEPSENSTGPPESKETEPEPKETPAETTPAPRGLSNILARRRLVQRRPGTVA